MGSGGNGATGDASLVPSINGNTGGNTSTDSSTGGSGGTPARSTGYVGSSGSNGTDTASGSSTGTIDGAFSSGGPPIVLYLYSQEDDPRLAVGTVQAVFCGAGIYRLVIVGLGERGFTADMLGTAALLAPVVILGTLAGYLVARRVSCRAFLLGVYGVIILAGAMNIAKGIKVWG